MAWPHLPKQESEEVRRERALPVSLIGDLIDGSEEGLAIVDGDERVAYINPAGARLMGVSPEELIGGRSPFAELERNRELEVRIRHASDGQNRMVHFRSTAAWRRERQVSAFADTAAAIAREPALEVVLDRLADEVRSVTGMPMCAVVLLDGPDGQLRYAGKSGLPPDYINRLEVARRNGAPMVTTEAFRLREPVVARGCRTRVLADQRWAPVHDLLRDVDWDTFVSVPLVVRQRAIGALNGFHHAGHDPDEEDVRFLSVMADHAAIAVDNARMLATLKLRAADTERERLARDLHDSVNQALFSLSLQARGVELTTAQREPELATQLADLRELAQNALSEMRALIQFRRPAELRDEGLVRGLERLAAATQQRSGLCIRVERPPGHLVVDELLEDDLYRLVQEALNNAVKHAHAHEARIVFRPKVENSGDLVLEVTDDGVGLRVTDSSAPTFGMSTMRERAERHGAHFEVHSRQGGSGTMVRVTVPGALLGRTMEGTQ